MFLVFPLLATACTWFVVANQVLFPLEGEGRGGRACAWGWWRRRRPGRGRRGFKRGSFFSRATTVERPRGGASSASRRPRSARGQAPPPQGAWRGAAAAPPWRRGRHHRRRPPTGYKFGPNGARWHKCILIKTNGIYYYCKSMAVAY